MGRRVVFGGIMTMTMPFPARAAWAEEFTV
jgi:hypothetical protein